MKSMIDIKTGLFLTQASYDAWANGQTAEPVWTTDVDQAAVFDADDAPPADDRFRVVDAP